MKFTFYAVVAASLIFVAQARADDNAKLQESLKKWETMRKQISGNYSYKVRWSSFTGFGHETQVIVTGNKVTERRFKTFDNKPVPPQPDKAPKKKTHKWIETGDQLGKNMEGAPVKTLDTLYKEAAEVLKRKLPESEKRYLRFDGRGLLLACFTVDTRIADDAPIKGVNISSIKFGKTFPAHWGDPPRIQTRDLRPLPGGYCRGSGTLAKWIQKNLNEDAKNKKDVD